jgi:hypothetical protein
MDQPEALRNQLLDAAADRSVRHIQYQREVQIMLSDLEASVRLEKRMVIAQWIFLVILTTAFMLIGGYHIDKSSIALWFCIPAERPLQPTQARSAEGNQASGTCRPGCEGVAGQGAKVILSQPRADEAVFQTAKLQASLASGFAIPARRRGWPRLRSGLCRFTPPPHAPAALPATRTPKWKCALRRVPPGRRPPPPTLPSTVRRRRTIDRPAPGLGSPTLRWG